MAKQDSAPQARAIEQALVYILKMPPGTVWSLTATDDDTAERPTTLNIFAQEEKWTEIHMALSLGRVVDRSTDSDSEQFVSYRNGALLISFIEYKEKTT